MNNYYFTATEEFKMALREIYTNYFSSNYIYSSNEFQKLLFQKIKLLKTFPRMYPIIDKKQEHRKIPILEYIIIYRVQDNNIHFVNIIPTKSNKYNHLYYT